MDLQAMILARRRLREELIRQRSTLEKMCRIVTRKQYEISRLIRQHDELDRTIFEETVGVTYCEPTGLNTKKKPDKKPKSVDINNLSPDMAKKLYERLQNRIDSCNMKSFTKPIDSGKN